MKNWLRTMATEPLPIRSVSLDRLAHLRRTDESLLNVADVANVVLADPLLAYQLLRHVASIERVREPLTLTLGIEHAIMLIGLDQFFNRFGSLPSLESRVAPAHMPAIRTAYARARFSAWLVKEWLALNEEHRVEEYFVAALLYQVPLCCRALDTALDPQATPDEVAKKRFGAPYDMVLSELLTLCRMPPQALEMLSQQSHETIDRRKLVLRCAIQITSRFDEGWWSKPVVHMLDNAADLLQQPRETLWQVLTQIALYLARHPAAGTDNDRFARELALLPIMPLVSENEFLFFDWSSDERMTQLDQSIRRTLASLSLQLGCDRLAFFAVNPTDQTLRNHYRIGFEHEDQLIGAVLSLDHNSFFHAFGQKTQAIRIAAPQLATIRSRFQDNFFVGVPENGCAMISLHKDGAFKGLFYIDNAQTGRDIDDVVYQSFKAAIIHLANM